jgi:uncharacterized protein YozE (UPF0346 family)
MYSFSDFLKTKENDDSPIGDFADDWLRDKSHPDTNSFTEIYEYIRFKSSHSDVIIALMDAYKEYIKWYHKKMSN